MQPTRRPKLAPYLAVKDATSLVGFLEKGLGGKVTFIEKGSGGVIHHAEVRIADSVVMLADVPAGRDPFPAMMHLYVPDVDASYRKALKAGAVSVRKPANQPDGDRRGGVRDAWGNEWWLTTPGGKA
jgi:PhnB protein